MDNTPECDVRPVEVAEKILTIVGKLGVLGLEAHIWSRESYAFLLVSKEDDEPNVDAVVKRVADACWNGLSYFQMWLGDRDIAFTGRKLGDVENLGDRPLESLSDGVYYAEFWGSESHYFVWVINGERLTYAGTYGGAGRISLTTADRLEYLGAFRRAMKGSLKEYARVFDAVPEVSSVGFQFLNLRRSPRYVSTTAFT